MNDYITYDEGDDDLLKKAPNKIFENPSQVIPLPANDDKELPLVGEKGNMKVFSYAPPHPKHFLKVRASSPFHILAVDLMDMSKSGYPAENDGVKYALVCVDVFSRYMYATPLKGKDSQTLIDGFKIIYNQMPKSPSFIWVDGESGIKSNACTTFLKEKGTRLYTTYGEAGAVYAENGIKKLKKIVFTYIFSNDTKKWVPCLERAVKKINETIISTTGLTPSEMLLPKNFHQVFVNFYGDVNAPVSLSKYEKKDYNIGDEVYITREKNIFERFYDSNFSTEHFIIYKKEKIDGIPIYRLKDKKGEKIDGHFYSNELIPV